MNKNIFKKFSLLLTATLVLVGMLTGCGGVKGNGSENSSAVSTPAVNSTTPSVNSDNSDKSEVASSEPNTSATELYVRFGDSKAFAMHLYDNDTAAAIAHHVGTADWQLPIYHYDDYDNWEVMQYYDIPSRYEIPSNPQSVTSESAGTVYYSEPNRIVLFYGDAEVSAEYTQVGYFDVTEEFVSAIENNPIVQGWGNKLIHISVNE